MSSTPSNHISLRNFCCARLISLPRKAVFSWGLATLLLLPASLPAQDGIPESIEPVADLALHQPPVSASSEIRMTLYGLKNWRLEAPASESGLVAGTSDADELKKQAQTRYLANKLKKQESTLRQYVDLAWAEAAKRKSLNPELIIAIIHKESEFRPKVQSRYGAQGLMQVVPRWHREKLQPSESLFDPEVNIRVGADVLEEYLAQAGGNMDNALRKYSGNARNYASAIKKESRALARIAEQAAG